MYRRVIENQENHLDIMVIDNPYCYAEISLQGAQVLQFYSKSKQKHILWCADEDTFKENKAIRGGIPLCFPWFGAHKDNKALPSHGFARQSVWQMTQVIAQSSGENIITFSLSDSPSTRNLWDYAFKLEMKMTFAEMFSIDLSVHNRDTKPFFYAFALHTYYAVSDINNIKIKGLGDCHFIDQLNSDLPQQVEDQPIQINQEIDRVYQDVQGSFELHDQHQITQIKSMQCNSAVVWNPWQQKASRLGDLKDNQWRKFVCIENGQIDQHREQLDAGQSKHYRLEIQML